MNHVVVKARSRNSEYGVPGDYQPWVQRTVRPKSFDAKVLLEEKSVESTEAELSQTPTQEKESIQRTTTVMGTTKLYENGQLRYVPMPTPDPRDPLNLPKWRKVAALGALCFFGALGLSAEIVIGALMPVFAMQYAGIDPHIISQIDLSAWIPKDSKNPLALLENLPGPPLWRVTLLSSLPILTNGIASYFLVPLSISIGRRPVLVVCGMLTWIGGIWAACSTSLSSHLGARCVQAIGAGSVEALVPLTVADLIFIQDRNKAMSLVWASQGIIIVALGVCAPIVVADYSWRILYWITSGLAIGAWLMLIAFLPESRWKRSKEELSGMSVYTLEPGELRPKIDNTLGRRTLWHDLGFFVNGFDNKSAIQSILDTLRTMVFPNVIWIIIINSVFMSVQNAAQQSMSTVLIVAGWKFKLLGLAVMPLVIATPFVWLVGGWLADKISNWHAKRNGGKREPEAHLLNLVLPLTLGGVGCVIFGYASDHLETMSSMVVLVGLFFVCFGFLTANSVLSVYMIESYPQWAGPVLVNVSSFRCVIGFAMSFRSTDWITKLGYLGSFGIYAGVLGFGGLCWPIFYFYGKQIRLWTSGTVATTQRVSR